MPKRSVEVTPALLRGWPLPDTASTKYARGRVLVIGGAAQTPGAAQLAGLAALRVGAGHLTLAVSDQVATSLAVATPEAGVIGLPSRPSGTVLGGDISLLVDDLEKADVVLIGPGLDDLEQSADLVERILPRLGESTRVVLDAYALAQLKDITVVESVQGRLVLSPNETEAQALLDSSVEITPDAVSRIATQYGAVVSCQGTIASPSGDRWQVGAGHPGLATSGSGDVLAGAVAGTVAGGAELDQAVCWATYVHAAAGDRLAARIGRLGFLAREILDELPAVMVELDH
jgi:ADP-dependent NAD(P)H-hydrate dehydratase